MTTTSIRGAEFSADYYDQIDHWSACPLEYDFASAKAFYHTRIEDIFDKLTGASLCLSTGEVIADADSPEMDYLAIIADAAREALEDTEKQDIFWFRSPLRGIK